MDGIGLAEQSGVRVSEREELSLTLGDFRNLGGIYEFVDRRGKIIN